MLNSSSIIDMNSAIETEKIPLKTLEGGKKIQLLKNPGSENKFFIPPGIVK